MTIQTNAQGFPQITSPIVDASGLVQQVWYQFFVNLWNRTGGGTGNLPGAVIPLTVTSSPFTYQAPVSGHMWINQGTYVGVTVKRGSTTLVTGKLTRGIIPLSVGDTMTITYTTLPPTLAFVPF